MKQETKRIILFLAITFALTYTAEIGFIWPLVGNRGLGTNVTAQLLTSVMMFMPAVGVILTRLFTKEGFRNHYLTWTWNKANMKYYLFAWVGPAVLTLLGGAVYFLVFPQRFDLDMSYLVSVYKENGRIMEPAALRTTIISQMAAAVVFAPLLNCITCFGEEWGWRGYLLPKMAKRFDLVPLLLINGIIWGLWHAPLTIMGHNYGTQYPGYPYLGIAAMCIFCIVLGILFSYVTMKTGSCIPSIIAHGAVNGFASAMVYFTDNGGNALVGPGITGIVGGLPMIITAILLIFMMKKEQTLEEYRGKDLQTDL